MKHSKLKRAVAFALVFNITLQSTSIAQGLVASGLTRYLGGVGERIVEYVKSNYAFAADPDESQTEAPEGGGSGETGHGPDCVTNVTQVLECKCDLAGTLSSAQSYADGAASSAANKALEDAKAYTKKAVGALSDELAKHDSDIKGLLDDVQDEIEEQGGNIKDAIESFASQNKTDHADLLTRVDSICSVLGVPGYTSDETTETVIGFLAQIENWNEGISNTLNKEIMPDVDEIRGDTDNMNSVLSALASSWFRIQPNENSGIEGTPSEEKAGKTYNMYYLVDKVHESTTVLVPSLGYGTVDENGAYLPNEDGRDPVDEQLTNYIWTEMQQTSLSADLSQLNHNLYSNFGYHQYEITKEDGSKLTLSEFQPSVAKDFATLIGMFKNYHVAHVYSLNCEEDAPWQPTPDEISYAKERVLNKGYANAYLGFWAVDSVENKPGYTSRWEYVLGKDILTPYEGYTITINKNGEKYEGTEHVDGTTDDYRVESKYVTSEVKNMTLDGNLTLSDMFRILYRAVGRDIVTVNTIGIPDKSIIAETSPAAQGLSNISTLYGDKVYVYAIRNNLMENTTSGPRYYNLYLQQAKKDGFIGNISNEQADTYYVTWADVWYYAYAIMDRYGEPVLNTTEIQSMLQLFGSNYPVQEGAVVADSWAYLMAKGCIAGNFSANNYVVVEDFLDLAMRIADEDSRITYKNVQLVVALDEAVVDTGYFPVFNKSVQPVEQYANAVKYNYADATHYDTYVSIPGIDVTKYQFSMQYYDSQGDLFDIPEEDEVRYVGNAQTKQFRFCMPFTRTNIAGVRITGENGNHVITVDIGSQYLGGGVIDTELTNNVYEVTGRTLFNKAGSSDYDSCVDTERAQKEISFSVASIDASLIDRVKHFFVYVFKPTTAYAALILPGRDIRPVIFDDYTLANKEDGSGLPAALYGVNIRSKAAACLLACYTQNSEGRNDVLSKLAAQTHAGWNANAKVGPTSVSGSLTNISVNNYKMWKQISLGYAAQYYILLQEWDGTSVIDPKGETSGSYRIEDVKKELEEVHSAIFAECFYATNLALSATATPVILTNYTAKLGTGTIVFEANGMNTGLVRVRQAVNQSADAGLDLLTNVNEEYAAQQEKEIVQGSTTNGVGSITHVSSLYADAIMHRDSTYFVAYASLVEQGIVSTQKQPAIENGILTFYLSNRGRVTIDTVNNIVMINSIYIDYGDSEPIFITDNQLYINYSCLVGSGIKLDGKGIDDAVGEATEVVTTTGSGTNVTYQVATGIAAIDGTSANKLTYSHYENTETSLYQYYLKDYNSKSTDSLVAKSGKGTVDADIILLSGVFPIGNWAIVEGDDGTAYAYVFYNKGLFHNTYFDDTFVNHDADATYRHFGIGSTEEEKNAVPNWDALLTYDTSVAEAFSAEKGMLSRVMVEKGTVLDKLADIYGMDTQTVLSHKTLATTYYTLAKLTEATGILINNSDWYARRFPIELTNTIDNLEVGKVYYLTNVGYVYVAPRFAQSTSMVEVFADANTNPMFKFATSEYALPYYTRAVSASRKLYDFNTNAYCVEDGETFENISLDYGYTFSTTNSNKDEAVYIVGYNMEDTTHKYKLKKLDNKTNVIPAPAGIFRFLLSSEAVDSVIIGSLTKYSTQAASFYYGTKQLVYHEEGTDTTSMAFTEKGGKQQVAAVLKTDTAFVSTRDYKGKHHFILQPSMTPPSKVVIKPVDANSYITGYSDNPIYGSIKQWISDLDDTTTFLLQIIFYFMPYVMLIWVLLLICLAIIPHHTVLSVSKLIGVDLVSFLTLGRREVTNWHGYKVTIPLIIAFVSIGLFYGPNLLRIIETVSKWAYDIAGLS